MNRRQNATRAGVSTADAGNRAKFEAAQSARADRKSEARQMR